MVVKSQKKRFFRGKQRYKCHVCGRQFSSRDEISLEEVWYLYFSGKQTYSQLAEQFCCSTKTIQRRLDQVLILKRKEFFAVAVVIMDTTYFGRGFADLKNKLRNHNGLAKERKIKFMDGFFKA